MSDGFPRGDTVNTHARLPASGVHLKRGEKRKKIFGRERCCLNPGRRVPAEGEAVCDDAQEAMLGPRPSRVKK
jgi:hypothetical protein